MSRLIICISVFIFLFSCKGDKPSQNTSAKTPAKTQVKSTAKPDKKSMEPTNMTNLEADNEVIGVDIHKVTVAQAKQLVKEKGYRFLDIRTPKEIERGKIDGAMEINIKTYNFQQQIDKLSRNSKLIVYDSAGNRSALAAKLFSILGFSEVVEMPGGYSAWTEAEKNYNN